MKTAFQKIPNKLGALLSLAIIAGWTYLATAGWDSFSKRAAFEWIVAGSLAVLFIYFSHLTLKRQSSPLINMIGLFCSVLVLFGIANEGGVAVPESMKSAGSARQVELEAKGEANNTHSVTRAEENLSKAQAAYDSEITKISSMKSEMASVATLSPAELDNLENEKAQLVSGLAQMEAERAIPKARFWGAFTAATGLSGETVAYQADAAMLRAKGMLSGVESKIESSESALEKRADLKSQIAGLEGALPLKADRVAKLSKSLSSAETNHDAKIETFSALTATRNFVFEKTENWATNEKGETSESKLGSILFLIGALLTLIVNIPAAFMLALSTIPEEDLIGILRRRKPKGETLPQAVKVEDVKPEESEELETEPTVVAVASEPKIIKGDFGGDEESLKFSALLYRGPTRKTIWRYLNRTQFFGIVYGHTYYPTLRAEGQRGMIYKSLSHLNSKEQLNFAKAIISGDGETLGEFQPQPLSVKPIEQAS